MLSADPPESHTSENKVHSLAFQGGLSAKQLNRFDLDSQGYLI